MTRAERLTDLVASLCETLTEIRVRYGRKLQPEDVARIDEQIAAGRKGIEPAAEDIIVPAAAGPRAGRRPPGRPRGGSLDDVMRLYVLGASISEITRQTGVTRPTVRKYLLQNGAKKGRAGRKRKPKEKAESPV